MAQIVGRYIASSSCITECLLIHRLEAAIHGQLGQHQTVGPDGQPILDDPRFLVFERVSNALSGDVRPRSDTLLLLEQICFADARLPGPWSRQSLHTFSVHAHLRP